MILRNLGALERDPAGFVIILVLTVVSLLIAITVHEFSHAIGATGFGDPTPRRAGRLSLNPLAHLDILGGLMLLLVGFGWAKPVPVNPAYFSRDPLRKMALVAAAGPLSNLGTAFLASLPFRAGLVEWPFSVGARLFSTREELLAGTFLAFLLVYNLILAAFNLIPLAPLDGAKVLPGIVPRDVGEALHRLEPWGPGILLMIIMADFLLGVPILSKTIGPLVNVFSTLFVGHRVL